MKTLIHQIPFGTEQEVIFALQGVESFSSCAGFEILDITLGTTALSELAINFIQKTDSGYFSFFIDHLNTEPCLFIAINKNRPENFHITDLLNGKTKGKSVDKPFIDFFDFISVSETGTEILVGKKLPDENAIADCKSWLSKFSTEKNYSPLKEYSRQNQAFIDAYDKLQNSHPKIKPEKKGNTDQETNWFILQSILNNAPFLVYVKDLNGKYLLSNEKYNEVFDYAEGEIIGKTDFDLVSIEKATSYQDVEKYMIKEKKSIEKEEIIEYKGKETNLLVIKFPLFNKRNEIYGIGGIATDITERVQFRKALIASRKQAENAEQLQEQFLANMSHEIRTPMNGIIGMTNLVLGTNLDNEQRDFIEVIKKSSDNLLFLINDILDLSKIKAGKLNIESIDFRLRETIENTIASFRPKVKEKQLILRVSVDMGISDSLIGDPFRLNQILTNLLSNAIKFTHKGEISLEVKLLNKMKSEMELEFSVSDTGIGVENDKLNHIFESFTQAETGTTRKFGGTGLGLSITKNLVQLQNGKIDAQSKMGEGTVFKVCLTYGINENKVAIKPVVKQKSIDDDGLFGKKILIVEDNITNQKVIYHQLLKGGLEPDLADNGKDAIKLIEGGFTYDLVIMDLQMPEMNGFETTEYIRKTLKMDIPIIAMTASALRNEKERCLAIGMNEYLTKPFVPEDLFKQLRRFLLNKNGELETQELKEPIVQLESRNPYNLSYLIEMEDLDCLIEVLQLFLESTPETMTDINEAIDTMNWEGIRSHAHKLKSSLGILQLTKLLTLTSQIELDAKEKRNFTRIVENMETMENLFKELKPMLETEIENAKIQLIHI